MLDEVTGWQDAYDTVVGPKLVKETVLRDHNNPCVVVWDHGNEGGWDFANEPGFHRYDIQKRPVIYPWLLRNGVDTHHYPEFNFAIGRNVFGNDPFMATELLHGLYDGGIGAGLEEYWRSYESTRFMQEDFLWCWPTRLCCAPTCPERFLTAMEIMPRWILGPHCEKEAVSTRLRKFGRGAG